MSNFQIVFLGVLVLLAIVGVATFAVVKTQSTPGISPIVIWGTVPEGSFGAFIQKFSQEQGGDLKVSYVQKSDATFDTDLAEALAAGSGPDVILLSQDRILRQKAKISLIPFTAVSQRQFEDMFIQEGSLFLTANGALALPFAVDPLVMYWNRDLFNNASLPTPPALWSQLLPLVKTFTVKNNADVISQSTVAMGEFQNVSHAKSILSTLFVQSGDTIAGGTADSAKSVFGQGRGDTVDALRFYTQFADPTNTAYSWNRSLPASIDAFAAGDLAMYFGFASELPAIRAKNSNLNFDVALLPQQDSGTKMTYGELYGFAILKQSTHAADALADIAKLTSSQAEADYSALSSLAPARLDLLGTPPSDTASPVFYSSALFSRGWLDPNAAETASIFQNMIEDVSTGRAEPNDAIDRAGKEMQALFE